MNIVCHSSYLPACGGGEMHVCKFWEVLSRNNDVEIIYVGSDKFFDPIEERFNIDLSHCKKTQIDGGMGTFGGIISEMSGEADLFLHYGFYDIVPRAKRNVLFYTVPWNLFKHVDKYDLLLANSQFTADGLKNLYPNKEINILCPFAGGDFKTEKKENIILTVGRFNLDLHQKKQYELIKLFNSFKLKNWKFYVVGSAIWHQELKYFEKCRNEAGQNVVVLKNVSHKELVDLNGRAKLYWHATGLGDEDPTKFEHFGMAVIEAMAAGVVPLVINKGEPPNLVGNSDQIWLRERELLDKTIRWAGNPEELVNRSNEMIKRAHVFNETAFENKVIEILDTSK